MSAAVCLDVNWLLCRPPRVWGYVDWLAAICVKICWLTVCRPPCTCQGVFRPPYLGYVDWLLFSCLPQVYGIPTRSRPLTTSSPGSWVDRVPGGLTRGGRAVQGTGRPATTTTPYPNHTAVAESFPYTANTTPPYHHHHRRHRGRRRDHHPLWYTWIILSHLQPCRTNDSRETARKSGRISWWTRMNDIWRPALYRLCRPHIPHLIRPHITGLWRVSCRRKPLPRRKPRKVGLTQNLVNNFAIRPWSNSFRPRSNSIRPRSNSVLPISTCYIFV